MHSVDLIEGRLAEVAAVRALDNDGKVAVSVRQPVDWQCYAGCSVDDEQGHGAMHDLEAVDTTHIAHAGMEQHRRGALQRALIYQWHTLSYVLLLTALVVGAPLAFGWGLGALLLPLLATLLLPIGLVVAGTQLRLYRLASMFSALGYVIYGLGACTLSLAFMTAMLSQSFPTPLDRIDGIVTVLSAGLLFLGASVSVVRAGHALLQVSPRPRLLGPRPSTHV
jgi:hypothetical protein